MHTFVLFSPGSSPKRYIAIGTLVALLLIIIIVIIVCRKRFQLKQDKCTPKVRQYRELSIPIDAELDQTKSLNEEPETPGIPEEDPWNGECKMTQEDPNVQGAFYLRPMRKSEASGYCSLSEEGDSLEFKTTRTFTKPTPKKSAPNKQDELEYTELLTVV